MVGRRHRWLFLLGVAALGATATTQGCSCGGDDSQSPGTGGGGTGGQGGAGGSTFTTGSGGGGTVMCDTPCEQGQICSHGVCVPLVPCTNDNDCANDTYCDPAQGCLPWEGAMPPNDEQCINVIAAGIFSPKVKCEFSAAPAGDPFPDHVDVQGTPIVVNFNVPASSGPPSIAASFTATVPANYTEELGVIRVLRGDDCSVEVNLGGTDVDNDGVTDWLVSSASLAAGDLDGDGSAEIVAYGADGSTLAFTRKAGVWSLLWKAPLPAGVLWTPCDTGNHRCGNTSWAGPAIHDLDDDGVPEVLREGAIFAADGTFRSAQPPGYASYSVGLFSVTANLDEDAFIEHANGQFIWEWNGAWVQEAYFPGASPSAPGHVALANFGAYGAGVPEQAPELAVVRGGQVMVYARDGSFAQPPTAVPGANPGGGPPTISDFDGDGLPELAVAGRAYYTVYDIDCGPDGSARPGGVCQLGPCDFNAGACAAGGYIAWSRQTQDISSNVTGSSVFDFEADGVSEVVYGDECFTRVYNGQTGDVLFSQYRSSCTWYENPIIADVDGNFRADLVVPSNKACSPAGAGIACTMLDPVSGVDVQFPGLRCEQGADCVSGFCDQGFCRCTSDAQCCGAMDDAACLAEGYHCAAPPAGTPGSGNTCRAAHPAGVSGIRVYSDANDKWVRSRTIWNQHAYAVTHVNEDGTIPQTSQWMQNWTVANLNNFRQNVPGTPNGNATGDATAGASDSFSCSGATANLLAPICNRGADSIAAGLSVGFYVNGMKVCGAATTQALAPGECETVACAWDTPPPEASVAVDVTVIPNDDGAYAECKDGNNEGTVLAVFCTPPQ